MSKLQINQNNLIFGEVIFCICSTPITVNALFDTGSVKTVLSERVFKQHLDWSQYQNNPHIKTKMTTSGIEIQNAKCNYIKFDKKKLRDCEVIIDSSIDDDFDALIGMDILSVSNFEIIHTQDGTFANIDFD